ncbi:hypothetical protein DUNSADRAFT_10081 [Dunaliella salina]|uniref:Uncharacterized protein n=1 Tax=Dunaliella salina TaxID=3046 RepID=A0ABQ7GG21_DUNSA|nr:hypothetical protein DUNSADRAFT_10081 [Dunaliella salina]|eukprot:KAF5833549.1 hypothetical protein DUNSADRAFT_10081 [Dunaliella salina]
MKLGVKATFQLCETFKGTLPFPGAQGLELIGQLAGLVDTAIANQDNLEALRDRAAELMDVIIEKHTHEAQHSVERAPASTKYKSLMSQLCDLLQEISVHTREYCDRNVIIKLLMTSVDRDFHNEKVKQLGQLITDAHFSICADTHSMTTDMHAAMKRMQETICRETPCQDHTSEIQMAVDSLGGLDAVLADDQKKQQVMQMLDVGHRVTLAVLQKQKELIEAGFKAAAAENDRGVHRIIKHTDMRTFWKTFFCGLDKVSWSTWWGAFPDGIEEVIQDQSLCDQIVARLSNDAAKDMFKAYVEREDSNSISVSEVKLAFPSGASLMEVMDKILAAPPSADAGALCPDPALLGGAGSSSGPEMPPAKKLKQPGVPQKLAPCVLPLPDALYTGRSEEAENMLQQILASPAGGGTGQHGGLCLLAGAGIGKSSFGLDIGHKLYGSGICPGGAIMVDLREACTKEDVLARFSNALELEKHSEADILARAALRSQTYGGPAFLLVDNAEDPASGSYTEFDNLISKLAAEALLVVTSRVPIAEACLQQYRLGGISAGPCTWLLRQTAPDLNDEELREAVQLCKGVPLIVRLVGDAFASGRLTVQDVRVTTAVGDQTAATVKLIIHSLPRQQQHSLSQLAVFPSGFDGEGAAAVLGWNESRAHAMLSVLYRHGLVLYDPRRGVHFLHMAVRTAAQTYMTAEALEQSQVRFVIYTLKLLDQWAPVYITPSWHLPLSLARDHGPNTTAAFELAGKLIKQGGHHASGVPSAILSLDVEGVRWLLDAVGQPPSSTWQQLDHLADYVQGAEAGLAVALYI